MKNSFDEHRKLMLQNQLKSRGVTDNRVLKAMGEIPREAFVEDSLKANAYADSPLPIGEGQTISQPLIVGLMTQLLELKGTEKVLEIGTGCGYQTAILSKLAAQVFSVERHKKLAWEAERLLPKLGCHNVLIRVADGTHGWPEQAPYDAIIVTAGAPSVPQPLRDQLAEGGRLVIPVGGATIQTLTLVRKRFGRLKDFDHGECRFVRLIGRYGWPE